MKRIPQMDHKGKLYYPITLIDSEGYFVINRINYRLDLKRLKEFPTFRRRTLRVERGHPTGGLINEHRFKCIEIERVIGNLDNLTIVGDSNRSFTVKADFYPNPKMCPTDLRMFEEGQTDLAVRAIVDAAGNIDEIITWDLLPVGEPIFPPRVGERPPIDKVVFVSSNKGFTWFPAKFLWVGEKTFVWRNMLPGAAADGENTNNNHHTYFLWAEAIPELELKTYSGKDRPDYLLSRSVK